MDPVITKQAAVSPSGPPPVLAGLQEPQPWTTTTSACSPLAGVVAVTNAEIPTRQRPKNVLICLTWIEVRGRRITKNPTINPTPSKRLCSIFRTRMSLSSSFPATLCPPLTTQRKIANRPWEKL